MSQGDLDESFKSSTLPLNSQNRYVNYSLIAVVWLLGGNAVSSLMTNGNGLILLFILLLLFLDLCQSGTTTGGTRFPAGLQRG